MPTLALFLILFCLGAAAEAKSVDVMRLQQWNQIVGPVMVYSSQRAFRIERGPVVMVARAPLWRVCAFNKAKKLMVESSLAKAVAAVRLAESTTLALTEPRRPWMRAGSSKILGLSALCFNNNADGAGRENVGAIGQSPGVSSIDKLRFWQAPCDNEFFTRPCAEFLCANYGIPYLGGFPLRFSYFGQTTAFLPLQLRSSATAELARQQDWLQTRNCSKVKVEDIIFDMPRGFASTDNYTNLYLQGPVTKDDVIIKDLLKNPDSLFQSQ